MKMWIYNIISYGQTQYGVTYGKTTMEAANRALGFYDNCDISTLMLYPLPEDVAQITEEQYFDLLSIV